VRRKRQHAAAEGLEENAYVGKLNVSSTAILIQVEQSTGSHFRCKNRERNIQIPSPGWRERFHPFVKAGKRKSPAITAARSIPGCCIRSLPGSMRPSLRPIGTQLERSTSALASSRFVFSLVKLRHRLALVLSADMCWESVTKCTHSGSPPTGSTSFLVAGKPYNKVEPCFPWPSFTQWRSNEHTPH